ncbi:MAG: hypothetical protein WA996_22780 [Candidatus Promineifilaceae bacterium]
MSETTLRYLIAAILSVHGIGHVTGILAALQLSTLDSWTSRSWLLTGLIGDTASRVISFVLFLAALIGFVGAALALLGWLLPHEWWRSLSIVSALISLAALGLFWNAFPSFFPNKIGAIAVDIAVLVGLLWLEWPSEGAIGY